MIIDQNGNQQAWNDGFYPAPRQAVTQRGNPFGETMRSQVNSGPDPRYQFTSKELDAETGHYYFGARYYDAWSGRWMSVDPLASKYPGWSD